jgi:streptomycin 6-kinase
VLFDEQGEPVFIDPHPKIGSATFDWAFWCVYYVRSAGFEERIELCRQYTPCDIDEVLAWAVTLAVDGALYYLDTKDTTAEAMRAVLRSSMLKPVLQSGTQ